jgi:hypothetical protein
MLRGRCCKRVISDQRSVTRRQEASRIMSHLLWLAICQPLLSPIIPAHRRHSPVSPIIPVHTQKQGGGGASCTNCFPISPLFSSVLLTIQLSKIVGKPTFSFLHATKGKPKSTGRNACATNGERKAGTTCRAPTGGREPQEPTPRGGIGHYISKPKSTGRSACATR